LLRVLAPQVLGALTRRYGDFDAAEDAVQEALIVAAERWSRDGVPERPLGWLVQTASRRFIDQRRSEQARSHREALASRLEPSPAKVAEEDDSLVLLFLCTHPALSDAPAIALTLRAVGGLTTAEIARAFVVPEATMAQRISRAKATIRASGEPFSLPTSDERPARLRNVLRVLYLIFNEGYASSGGSEVQRVELSAEAIRLARMAQRLMSADAEALGLLALMLLIDARRPARTDDRDELVPLAEQDRSRWDRAQIAEGLALLDQAMAMGSVGEYQVQASIAAIHDRAPRAVDTDWPQILALYGLLEPMTGNPIVTLNRAVAAAMVHGPSEGLEILDGVAERLAGHYRLDAVRAHLLEMAGDRESAVKHYRAAAARTTNEAERRYLVRRAAEAVRRWTVSTHPPNASGRSSPMRPG
jgi:RNA polymerase sigma factor (sigma-70 family)